MGERRIGIVTPVLNDWESLEELLGALAGLAGLSGRLSIMVVDDGSTVPGDTGRLRALGNRLGGLEVIRLACSLGHQRAIAIGLIEFARRAEVDCVVVMDADGEDRPEDIPRLIEAHAREPEAIVVALRAERSETFAFRLLYRAYKAAFRLATGTAIDFGNFCLIPASQLGRLVTRPEIWNHLAATLVRSRAPLVRVPTARGIRYAGSSHMNLVALVTHGLSGMSVFAAEAFVRFLVASLVAAAGIVTAILVAVGIRFFTDYAIPGWATTVVGLLLVMLAQCLTLALALTFVMLAGRGTAPVLPVEHSRHFIRTTEVLA